MPTFAEESSTASVEIDPDNPWPVGSEWWRRHNETYSADKAKQRRNLKPAEGNPMVKFGPPDVPGRSDR